MPYEFPPPSGAASTRSIAYGNDLTLTGEAGLTRAAASAALSADGSERRPS